MNEQAILAEQIRVHFPDMRAAQVKQTAKFIWIMRQLKPDVQKLATRLLDRLANRDPEAKRLLHEFKAGKITAEELMQREAQS